MSQNDHCNSEWQKYFSERNWDREYQGVNGTVLAIVAEASWWTAFQAGVNWANEQHVMANRMPPIDVADFLTDYDPDEEE